MNPSLAHFQLLRRLQQQLRHHSRMSVVYLFSDYELANQWLISELDAHLRARSMRLQVLRPASSSDLTTAVLDPLLSPDSGMTGMPCWLAMSEPHAEWDSYRDQVLARLNENRSVLGRNKSFIFLLLPAHFEARAAEIAPDLWSVRSASHVVPPWRTGEEGGHANLKAPMPFVTAKGHGEPAPVEALVEQRWKKQWDQWSRDRSQQLSPVMAWQLVEQLLERHQPGRAQVFAAQALDISRNAPQSLRDLSVSLENVGNVARDLGQLEEARSAYAESLEISRQLKTLTGDSPQSLRDLSVSLDNAGDVARELGQLEEARSAYAESLEIRRQLKTLTSDSPQSLRDLSVSLSNVGNVARDLGQLEEARTAFGEALDLVKRLRNVLASDRELAPFEQALVNQHARFET